MVVGIYFTNTVNIFSKYLPECITVPVGAGWLLGLAEGLAGPLLQLRLAAVDQAFVYSQRNVVTFRTTVRRL